MKSAVDKPKFGGGSHKVGCDLFDDEAEGTTGLNLTDEHVSIYGHPAQLVKIASTVSGGSTIRDYPHDGSGIAAAGTNANGLVLAADILAGTEYLGLIVVPWTGAAIGRWRRVTGYNSGTRTVTPNRPWDVGFAPAPGDGYRLLVNTFRYGELHVAPAFNGDANAIAGLALVAALYDYPKLADGSFRAPRRYMDQIVSVQNQDHQSDCFEVGYYNGQSRTAPTRGSLGVKWRILEVPAVAVSLCSGAS